MIFGPSFLFISAYPMAISTQLLNLNLGTSQVKNVIGSAARAYGKTLMSRRVPLFTKNF